MHRSTLSPQRGMCQGENHKAVNNGQPCKKARESNWNKNKLEARKMWWDNFSKKTDITPPTWLPEDWRRSGSLLGKKKRVWNHRDQSDFHPERQSVCLHAHKKQGYSEKSDHVGNCRTCGVPALKKKTPKDTRRCIGWRGSDVSGTGETIQYDPQSAVWVTDVKTLHRGL